MTIVLSAYDVGFLNKRNRGLPNRTENRITFFKDERFHARIFKYSLWLVSCEVSMVDIYVKGVF